MPLRVPAEAFSFFILYRLSLDHIPRPSGRNDSDRWYMVGHGPYSRTADLFHAQPSHALSMAHHGPYTRSADAASRRRPAARDGFRSKRGPFFGAKPVPDMDGQRPYSRYTGSPPHGAGPGTGLGRLKQGPKSILLTIFEVTHRRPIFR